MPAMTSVNSGAAAKVRRGMAILRGSAGCMETTGHRNRASENPANQRAHDSLWERPERDLQILRHQVASRLTNVERVTKRTRTLHREKNQDDTCWFGLVSWGG